MEKSVVLYTTGIDSHILLQYVRTHIDPNTVPVYFQIGARYSTIEQNMVETFEPKAIIDTSLYMKDMEQDSAFIPNRNILLTTMAVSKYSKRVFIGGSKSDRVSDNNEKCFDELSRFLTAIDGKDVITITSPFWHVYKDDMVNWYVKSQQGNKGVEKLVHETFSCFRPEVANKVSNYHFNKSDYEVVSRHCYSCSACFRRNAVLYSAGIILPFYNEEIIQKYYDEFTSTIELDPTNSRASGTLKYINLNMKYRNDR